MTASESSDWAVYRRLLRYSLPYWRVFLFAVLGMISFAAVDTTFVRLIGIFIDGSFQQRDPEVIRWAPAVVVALMVARGLAGFVSSYGMAWVSQKVVLQLRNQVFEHMLHLPVARYDRERTADMLVKLTYHTSQVTESGTSVVTSIIKDGLTVIGLLGTMFYYSVELTLVALLVAPFIAASVRYVSRRFKTINARLQASMGGITHVADEAITGRRVVKLYGGEPYEARRFNQVSEFMRSQGMKLTANGAFSTAMVLLLSGFAFAAIIHRALDGNIASAGEFVAFLAAMMGLRAPLNSMTGIGERLTRGLVAARELFQFLDEPREAAGGSRPLARARGELEFDRVEFSYPSDSKRVLHGVSLHVKAGQTVAFVGRSGSGKSTLCSLVPRFYDPSGGVLRLDGHDVRDYPVADLRRQIALVDQNVVLFNGTVAENIAYGRRESVTESQIVDAARAAYAWDFIARLPQGLETPLGQNGVTLSGGQRQRIAIARALLRDAPILILDEATSALDTESERYIQQALERLVAGRTTLVIAHRLSTIQRADLIVVMRDGAVAESGRHTELLEKGGLYATLHQMQFEEPQPA